MLGEEQLEPDLHRRAVAEEDPALGGDQLVRPGEVRLVRLDAELVRSHWPPQGPGRNVGRVRNGRPASQESVARSASPASERGRPGR